MDMYVIDPGQFKFKIEILERVKTYDDAGSPIESWDEGVGFKSVKQTRACVKPVSAKDYFEAMANQMQITHKIIIRYTKGINHKMFIKFRGRKLDIVRIINIDEADKYLEIQAVESM